MSKSQEACSKLICTLLLSVTSVSLHGASVSDAVKASGIKGGLVVHIGCGNGSKTLELQNSGSFVIQGLDTSAENVVKAREHIESAGLYGRITVDTFDGKNLPYIDNLVNLVIADGNCEVSREEILRVLAPRGTAVINGKTNVKPVPSNIDEWSHYLHGPDNNAVANDNVIGPPRHLQWVSDPDWTRTHHGLNSISAIVTAGGRLFYIIDQSTAANMKVKSQWFITARDAFNGLELWNKPMESWVGPRGFRSGPPQVTRLLVASKNKLYAPLGLGAPVSVMDVATGKTLTTYDCTKGAEEIVLIDNVLLVLTGGPAVEHASKSGKANSKAIVAVNIENGKKLWEWSDSKTNPQPETLGADSQRVYFQINQSVTALDLKKGIELWTYGERGTEKKRTSGHGRNVLVVSDGVVLCRLGKLTAIDADDGKKLWDAMAGDGFKAPMDIFVIDGLVWTGIHPKDSISPPPKQDFSKGLNLRTGVVEKENQVMVDIQTAGHHHRCYREKATSRYIIGGKRGFEMMDLQGDNHSRANWARGTCQYGMLPANGLTYAPPHSCGCYPEAKLWGFYALAADLPGIQEPVDRLVKGKAYKKAKSRTSDGWLQMRGNALRSGVADTVIDSSLKQAWKVKLPGKLTQAVIADGKVVVSAIDENTVYALDEATGELAWKYTVGGRVDSAPAIHKGQVLFGSADGRLYCLRLSDGELAWKFMAAQSDLRTVSREQVESLWPVHGAVLILNDVVYCAAGRSTWLDRGIDLYGLDPETGNVLYKNHYESRAPVAGEGKESAKPEHVKTVTQNRTDYKTHFQSDKSDSFSMADGSVSDVLVSDGKRIFMHHGAFNAALERQDWSRHLFSTSGLLDGNENHRSHWVMGSGDFSLVPVAYSWIVNRGGWGGTQSIFALMMCYDDNSIWYVKRRWTAYSIIEVANKPFSEDEQGKPDFQSGRGKTKGKKKSTPFRWNSSLNIRPRAMLKVGDNLVFGGMPHHNYTNDSDGVITVVSAKDGKPVTSEVTLEAPVVWDGLAAANNCLYVSLEDGSLVCFKSKGDSEL